MFSCSVSVVLRDGVSARFWTDAWLPEGPVSSFARNLFLAVGRRFHRTSVQEALSQRRWVRHITGPPTMAVLCEYVDLWAKMESVQLRLLVQDRFVWRWTQDGVYSASSAYHSFLGMTSMLGAKALWKASAPPKVQLFFWLLLHGQYLDERSQDGMVCRIRRVVLSMIRRMRRLITFLLPVSMPENFGAALYVQWGGNA